MQDTILSSEIYWLTLTVAMTGLFWVPYIVNRLYEEGMFKAIWNPNPDAGPKAAWAQRMMCAHQNAVENLVIFIPLALIVDITGINNENTLLACKIYFIARALHYLVFTFGVPIMRVISFGIGVYAQGVLAIEILSNFLN